MTDFSPNSREEGFLERGEVVECEELIHMFLSGKLAVKHGDVAPERMRDVQVD